jgi:hypothetical protein
MADTPKKRGRPSRRIQTSSTSPPPIIPASSKKSRSIDLTRVLQDTEIDRSSKPYLRYSLPFEFGWKYGLHCTEALRGLHFAAHLQTPPSSDEFQSTILEERRKEFPHDVKILCIESDQSPEVIVF